MNDRRQTLVSWLLLTFAAVLIGLIVLFITWGGRIEATLLVFGVPVFLALDARHPGVLLLLGPPILLIGRALYVRWARTTTRLPPQH